MIIEKWYKTSLKVSPYFYGTQFDWNQTLITMINRCINQTRLQNYISIWVWIEKNKKFAGRICPIISCSRNIEYIINDLVFIGRINEQINTRFIFEINNQESNSIEISYGNKILAKIEII